MREESNFVDGKWIVITGYAALLTLIGGIVFVSFYFDQPVKRFTSDPADISDTHPFNGFLSNVGVVLWFSTCAISFFAYYFGRLTGKNNDLLKLLLYSGMLTLLLGVDDLFMLHEYILPETLHIPQLIVYAIYGLIVSAYFLLFYKQILVTKYNMLLLALFLLGSSVACDVLLPSRGLQYILEDGFKVLGIFTWLIYFIQTSVFILSRVSKPDNIN